MTLSEFAASVPGFASLSTPDRIIHFGWWLHTHNGKDRFDQTAVRKCYEDLHLQVPNLSQEFARLVEKKRFLKDGSGFRVEHKDRTKLDEKYAVQGHSIQITQLLKGLPAQIPDLKERTYLDEAFSCYTVKAFRASIVMTWNLAYHHLCDFILTKKLTEFNTRWPIWNAGHHKKAGISAVTRMEDFGEEFKESQVITIARDANIISGNVFKVMDEKLGIRNSAAHPSDVMVGQLQADYFIDDLVKNVVLRLV